jgi:predicted kinase
MGIQIIEAQQVQELVIVRGHPGSGKTTMAKSFERVGYSHFENDSFFTDANGNYKFDFAFHQVAKDTCENNVKSALEKGERVVVSNTFTKVSEFQSLIDFAVARNIPVRVVEMELLFKNVHDVPEEVVQAKITQFEKFDGAIQICYDFDVIL